MQLPLAVARHCTAIGRGSMDVKFIKSVPNFVSGVVHAGCMYPTESAFAAESVGDAFQPLDDTLKA